MKKSRPGSKDFVPIGSVLGKVLVQCRPQTNEALSQIWNLWEQVVGKDVASHARPAAFKADLLLIHVSNSTWLHHLRFLEKDLINQLNHALGGDFIRRVKFKIGPC